MSEESKKKKHISGSISARVLYALTPLIKQTSELADSDFAFMSQIDTRRFGCYLLPAEKGVVLAVVQSSMLLAVKDPDGYATEPLKVHFPDGLLDVVAPRIVTLRDENGIPFDVESEPKADRVQCVDGFGIVLLDKSQSEKYDGCLGTWFNGDHGNVIEGDSYRLEPVDAIFISKVVERPQGAAEAVSAVSLNPTLLKPITEAAYRLGLSVDLTMGGADDPVVVRSSDDSIYGLLMPMKSEQRGPSPLLDILSRKEETEDAAA